METVAPTTSSAVPALEIRLLGQVSVHRNGVPVTLPKSRKLRALLAILVTEGRPVGRRKLCDLLWDRPNDPRAELRWHLSKLRHVVDVPGRSRILSDEDEIGFDLDGCSVDALDVLDLEQALPVPLDRLAALVDQARGSFLGDLDLSGAAASLWLTAQRRRYASTAITLARALVDATPPEDAGYEPALDLWLDLAPFDIEAHCRLLTHLYARGRVAEFQTYLAAAERLFRDEGVPLAGLHEAARTARAAGGTAVLAAPRTALPDVSPSDLPPSIASPPRRSTLAVMPFLAPQGDLVDRGLAEGLTHDVITRLAKLRSLSITARASVRALADMGIGPDEAGRKLGVDYIAVGSLRRDATRVSMDLELSETVTGRIVWAEICHAPAAPLIEALDELGDRIVAALTGEIEQSERNRAILRPPASLDAWGAHHRGLWHMYRFTKEDNARAQHFFELATTLDPTFSRALAGLSFTHWQNAFQNWSDPVAQSERAYAAAAQSLLADEQDPAAHWAMGRALWLRNRHDEAVVSLHGAVELSPNFALGHYSLAFVESQTGDARAAIVASDRSRTLSPYDPLMFGIMGSRAIAHLRLGEIDQAADWAIRAAARPNAHLNILGLAALCLSVAGRADEGRAFATAIHAADPGYGIDDFLSAFHLPPEKACELRAAAGRVSLA